MICVNGSFLLALDLSIETVYIVVECRGRDSVYGGSVHAQPRCLLPLSAAQFAAVATPDNQPANNFAGVPDSAATTVVQFPAGLEVVSACAVEHL